MRCAAWSLYDNCLAALFTHITEMGQPKEAGKQARNKRSRAEKAAEQERRFAQRQEKRKAKHKVH